MTSMVGLYDLEETIGRGHFAVVKLAKHVFTGEKVAIKVIDKNKLDDISKAHLYQEVRCMKMVQHPNIVRLYEVTDTPTKLFLTLELGDYDLYDFIMQHSDTGIAEDEAQRYFSQIVEAISYCHQLHVVHRDLKPENVVFFRNLGMVKLTDFGFSNLFTPGQQLQTFCGSLAYSAPEILLGNSYDAPAVDVWSLGVILFMLVSGRLPFQEANDSETLTKILDCRFSLPDHISDDCRKLIKSMLVRNPVQRASLMEIAQCSWVKAGATGHSDALPLIIRDNITEELHSKIMNLMVSGGLADAERISKSLENNDYNHVTATYYLLAERFLRSERLEQAQRLSTPLKNVVAGSSVSPKFQIPGSGLKSSPEPYSTKIVPRRNGVVSESSSSFFRPGSYIRNRKCSVVREESEEEDQNSSDSSASNSLARFGSSSRESSFFINKLGSSFQLHELSLDLDLASNQSSRTSLSGKTAHEPADSRSASPLDDRISPLLQRYRGHGPTTTRKLTGISSSPQLLEISEEDEENSARLLQVAGCSSLRNGTTTDGIIVRDSGLHRSRRSTSCSSSETSDDEERRLGLVASHLARKDFDTDDDSDPPPSSGLNSHDGLLNSGRCRMVRPENGIHENSRRTISNGGGKETKAPAGTQLSRVRLAVRRSLDAILLSARHPFVTTLNMLCEINDWAKPLMKPRSCEFLQNIRCNSFTSKSDYKFSCRSAFYRENSDKRTPLDNASYQKYKTRRFVRFVEASRILKNNRSAGSCR